MITDLKIATVLAPATDVFSGTVTSAPVNMGHHELAAFAVIKGVGTTGTSTVTVEKCTLVDGTGAEAIPFKYRRVTNPDAPGDLLDAPAAGFTTTAGSNEMYLVYATVQTEGLAKGDKPYARVKLVEQTDSPVAGCILVLAKGARQGVDSPLLT